MKKRLLGILLSFCMTLALMPATALARCPMDALIGTNEIWGMTRTFYVGDPFDGIGQLNENKKNKVIVHTKNREWWANGAPLKKGDVFTKPGQYFVTLKTDGLVAKSYFQVMPKLNSTSGIREISVVTPPARTVYRQGADPFDPSGIVVSCQFSNGSTQDVGYEDLEFYEVWPDYKPPHTFVMFQSEPVIWPGHRFWRAGERGILIRIGNKCALLPITVTPFVSTVEMSAEPSADKFGKGKAIRTSDYAVGAWYQDGSTEIINGDNLTITANGDQNQARMFAGNDYEFSSVKNAIRIRMGDFTLPRAAEPGLCRVAPDDSPFDAPYRTSPNGDVVGNLPFGTTLEVTAIEGDWATVKYEGNTYYMWAARLKKIDTPKVIIKVTLNGTPIHFDQPPINQNGRTLVPLRAIFEAMGARIDWNADTQTATATANGTTISLTIGSNVLVKNGESITLDVPAQLIGGRTLVPARAVAEGFGARVDWDDASQTVMITK